MKKILTILLINTAFVGTAFANIPPCGHLNVQITNFTGSLCTLTSHKMEKGVYVTLPPMSVQPNESKEFQLVQSGFSGPSATVSYHCGAESVTINNKQDFNSGYDYFSWSDLYATVLPPKPSSFNVAYTAIPGTCSSAPGNISWVFIAKNKELKINLVGRS